MNENLVNFFKQRSDVFPLRNDIDLGRFLFEALDRPAALPVPAKIFLVDELEPHSYGFPVAKASALDDVAARAEKWLETEIELREKRERAKVDEALKNYRQTVIRLAHNALHSSILADYHAVFWLVHSQQLAKLFTHFPRKAMSANQQLTREQADGLKYALYNRWSQLMREALPEITGRRVDGSVDDRSTRFVKMLIDNPLLVTEDFISNDLGELRTYFAGYLRRDFAGCRKWFDELKLRSRELMNGDRVFRRAVALLGYPETPPGTIALLDRRVQQLVSEHPSFRPSPDRAIFEALSRKLLEFFIVYHLRRGIVWMKTTSTGDNVADDATAANTNVSPEPAPVVYSRAIRPMNFGRRGIVEPIVYRYGLVYDITSFTQTLGEIARGGKDEEQTSYRQMLDFQRDLSDITRRHGMQFEKFLGDGAFYTSRRATRTIQAAIEVQRFYSQAKSKGFAFNKGMRLALNYGYYRLLPMQVSSDGTEIMEFYGPGIVELSRLTTGKATKEIEDIQHLLLSHGYDQMEVYKFFAPLARGAGQGESTREQREFYAYVNENGHLINEGIVVSIPFLKQLSAELEEDQQKIYRLRTPWANYLGFPAALEGGHYIGVRILGSVSLKGIGNMDVGEVVRLSHEEAEISVLGDENPLLTLLQQERNRTTARLAEGDRDDAGAGTADLVVCESHVQSGGAPVILVGEWDPVSDEVRRPIQLDGEAVERYGLAMPLTASTVESQTIAYQKLYQKLSRIETLPSFSVQAIRDNTNFNGFIIGQSVEPL